MKTFLLPALVAGMMMGSAAPVAVAEDGSSVYPTAIFAFSERGSGVQGSGAKISDILFGELVVNPELILVDREDMKKILAEHELNLSGLVSPGQAIQVGQLTGAKIIVTGSIIEADKRLYLVAKIIGTETSRVLGASVKGTTRDELGPLVETLAQKVAETITAQTDKLVAKTVKTEDRIAAVKKGLGEAKRPSVSVKILEEHVGQAVIDPAAETEMSLYLRETGFELFDADSGGAKRADIVIKGEGFSEFAVRRGNLVGVKARVEIKAIDAKTDKVVAIDRQTAVVVDLTEQIAGKKALQDAAAAVAERMLPKLVQK